MLNGIKTIIKNHNLNDVIKKIKGLKLSIIKLIRNIIAYSAYLIVSVILLLEIIFRLLPTTSPVDLQVITEKKTF